MTDYQRYRREEQLQEVLAVQIARQLHEAGAFKPVRAEIVAEQARKHRRYHRDESKRS